MFGFEPCRCAFICQHTANQVQQIVQCYRSLTIAYQGRIPGPSSHLAHDFQDGAWLSPWRAIRNASHKTSTRSTNMSQIENSTLCLSCKPMITSSSLQTTVSAAMNRSEQELTHNRRKVLMTRLSPPQGIQAYMPTEIEGAFLLKEVTTSRLSVGIQQK